MAGRVATSGQGARARLTGWRARPIRPVRPPNRPLIEEGCARGKNCKLSSRAGCSGFTSTVTGIPVRECVICTSLFTFSMPASSRIRTKIGCVSGTRSALSQRLSASANAACRREVGESARQHSTSSSVHTSSGALPPPSAFACGALAEALSGPG